MQLFAWEGNLQDVVALKKRSCALEGVTLAASTNSPAYVNLNYTGSFFFSSSLADHCSAGQLLAVAVNSNNESGKQPNDLPSYHILPIILPFGGAPLLCPMPVCTSLALTCCFYHLW